ncbi:MAG: hypothetical protein ABR538_15380 [Candidatus Binatia bacterium]
MDRFTTGSVAAAALFAGLAMEARPAQAEPSNVLMRQITNITTGTIDSVQLRLQDARSIAFVSNGDVMGPGTQTANRQVYFWQENKDTGLGTITKLTNGVGCDSYDATRPTDDVFSDRPTAIFFVSTCNHDPSVGNGDGNPEIFIYKFDTSSIHQLTDTAAPVVNGEPFASDSGLCLVFSSNGNLDNNLPSNPNYDSNHPGPGFTNPDGSREVFYYGKLKGKTAGYPYDATTVQVSNGPGGTSSGHPAVGGYWFPRQCQTVAYHSDHIQIGQGVVGQGIYVYKTPASALEEVVAAEIPNGFPDGIYANPSISQASPFARGPHVVFEGEPDLWNNGSLGHNIYNWRDFHPRMTQYTNLGAGFTAVDPQVADGGGVYFFSSNGEILSQDHTLRTGEAPPFNADANYEIYRLKGRRRVTQITDTTGCHNSKPALMDDGGRAAFLSNCDLIAGENAGGLTQVFLWGLEKADHPLMSEAACQQADGCCIASRKLTTCYHSLKGKKPKISRPNCLVNPRGCQ